MIAIMQPTFLPWIGYFDLIDQVDNFIFLDDVQFSKQSWQQRNRVATVQGLDWITVPVINGRLNRLIIDVMIGDNLKKIQNKIENSYSNHPHFDSYWPEIKKTLAQRNAGDSLPKLNIDLIKIISSMLGVDANFSNSSETGTSDDRIDRLIDIIKHYNSDEYISPIGAFNYLSNSYNSFSKENIEVKFQNYNHPKYKLAGFPFHEGASVIDLIFTHGPRSIEIIRSGRSEPYKIEEL